MHLMRSFVSAVTATTKDHYWKYPIHSNCLKRSSSFTNTSLQFTLRPEELISIRDLTSFELPL